MTDELPKLFSDNEFNVQRQSLERRELADRRIEKRRVSPVQKLRRTDGLPESTMEQKFPHTARKLTLAWRSEACAAYISSLTVADRPGRQGFPAEVMEDLFMLNELNSTLINPAPKLANEGARHSRASTLPRPQEHPAHRAIPEACTGSLQRPLARLRTTFSSHMLWNQSSLFRHVVGFDHIVNMPAM